MGNSLKEKIGIKHRFRDPIYGYIWLNDKERELIDTLLFQRLRRILQVALTKYVYPTAEHSRFVHSLGVLYTASEIFEGIFRHENTILKNLTEHEQLNLYQLLRFAALLHDIGHMPFSHATEDIILSPFNHEEVSQYIIKNDPAICKILDEDTETVASILSKNYKQKYAILHEIISGQLDADRADYLLRDSYMCGVKYGEYDFHRYKQAFGVQQNTDGYLQLYIKEKDIFVIESFLLARYHYNLQVPFHRTRVGYDIVLSKFIESILNEEDFQSIITIPDKNNKERLKIDLEQFALFDDYYMWNLIKKFYKKGNFWAAMLLRQDHLIPLFDSNSYDINAKKILKQLKESLLANGYKENEDFFIYNKKVELIKPSDEEQNEKERNIKVLLEESQDKIDIDQYSRTVGSLKTKPLTIYRLYITPKIKKKGFCLKEKIYRKRRFKDGNPS